MLLSEESEPTSNAGARRHPARHSVMKRACTILAAFEGALQRAQTAQSPNATAAAARAALHQASAVLDDAAAWGWRWDAHGGGELLDLCTSGRYDAFLSESSRRFSQWVAAARTREFECTSDERGTSAVHTLAEVEDTLFEMVPVSAVRHRCATLLFSRLVAADVGDVVFHEDPFHGPEHYRRLR